MLRTLGTYAWFGPRVFVSNATKVFGPDARIVDEAVRVSVAKHLVGFSDFIARVGRPA